MKKGHRYFKSSLLLLISIICFAVLHFNTAFASVGYIRNPFDYMELDESKPYYVEQNDGLLGEENGVFLISNYTKALHIGVNEDKIAVDEIYYHIDRKSFDNLESLNDESGWTGVESRKSFKNEHAWRVSSFAATINPASKYTSYRIRIYESTGSFYDNTQYIDDLLEEFVVTLEYHDFIAGRNPSITITKVTQLSDIEPTDLGGQLQYFVKKERTYYVTYKGHDLPRDIVCSVYSSSVPLWNKSYTATELEDGVSVGYDLDFYSAPTCNYVAFDRITPVSSAVSIMSERDNEIPYFSNFSLRYSNTKEQINGIVTAKKYDKDNNNLELVINGEGFTGLSESLTYMEFHDGYSGLHQDLLDRNGADIDAGYTVQLPISFHDFPLTFPLNGTIDNNHYDVVVTLGGKTRTIGLSYVNKDPILPNINLFSIDGLPLDDYRKGGSAGPNGSELISEITKDALGEHGEAYMYLSGNPSSWNGYSYYVYYYDASSMDVEVDGLDYSNAELLSSGEFGNESSVGIMINNHSNYSVPGYSVVVVDDEGYVSSVSNEILYIVNYSIDKSIYVNPVDGNGDELQNIPAQFANSVPVRIQLFESGLDPEKEYSLEITDKANFDEVQQRNYTVSKLGSEFNGEGYVYELPSDWLPSSEYMNSREIKVVVKDGSEVIAKGSARVWYYNDPSEIYDGTPWIDVPQTIRDIKTKQSESRFAVTLSADNSFEEEFDVFLSVDGYENLSNTCGGICGVVGKLEYDTSKIELVSAEALEEFEITQGEKIVLNRPTGVAAGTAIMKLHFRSVAMSANTSTTINFTNIVGSDGTNNISANDASISVRKTLSFYSLVGRLFASTGEQFNGNVQSYSSDFMIMKFDVDSDTFNNDGYLTAVFDGLGFTANTPYIYSLKSFPNGSDDKETLFSGEVTADEISKGSLKFKLTNPSNSSDTMYELVVKKGDNTIFTSSINIVLNNEPHFSEAVKYGYSDSDFIGSHYILPTNSASSVIIKASNIDTSKNYRISTNNSEYKSCTTVPNGTGVITSCDGPVQGQAIPDITVSGENLSSGYSVSIPMPVNTSTIRTLGIKIYEEGVETSIESITVSQWFVEDSDIIVSAETLVLDDYILSNIPLGTIASSVQSSIIVNNAYSISIISDAGSELAQNDKIGTGSKIRINNIYGQTVLEYTARIKGDLNGDGNITITDLVKAKRHLALIAPVEGIYAEAADITRSGFIGITDIVKICRHIAGLEVISQ